MDTIYIGAIVGLISGSLGYTIARFVVRPIFMYAKLKKQMEMDINNYLGILAVSEGDIAEPEKISQSVKLIKEHASELGNHYENVLPNWYKILLKQKEESPIEAIKHLGILANTKNYEHAKSRVEKIKQSLKI